MPIVQWTSVFDLVEHTGFDRQLASSLPVALFDFRLTVAARAPDLPPEAPLLARSPLGSEPLKTT